mgnify:CR=1 FL=1
MTQNWRASRCALTASDDRVRWGQYRTRSTVCRRRPRGRRRDRRRPALGTGTWCGDTLRAITNPLQRLNNPISILRHLERRGEADRIRSFPPTEPVRSSETSPNPRHRSEHVPTSSETLTLRSPIHRTRTRQGVFGSVSVSAAGSGTIFRPEVDSLTTPLRSIRSSVTATTFTADPAGFLRWNDTHPV